MDLLWVLIVGGLIGWLRGNLIGRDVPWEHYCGFYRFLVRNGITGTKGAGDTCSKEKGISIPDEMAVIGFDNQPIAKIMNITTIEIPLVEMGRKLLLQAISNEDISCEEIAVNLQYIQSVGTYPYQSFTITCGTFHRYPSCKSRAVGLRLSKGRYRISTKYDLGICFHPLSQKTHPSSSSFLF